MLTFAILLAVAPAPCVPATYVDDLGAVTRLRVDNCAGPVVSIDFTFAEANAAAYALLAAIHDGTFSMLLTDADERFEAEGEPGHVIVVVTTPSGDDNAITLTHPATHALARRLRIAASTP